MMIVNSSKLHLNLFFRFPILPIICVANLGYMHLAIQGRHLLTIRILDYFEPFFLPFCGVVFDISVLVLSFSIILFFTKNIWIYIYWFSYIWSILNVVYSRYFQDYLSMSVFANANNLEMFTPYELFDYFVDSLRLSDFYYILSISLFFILLKNNYSIYEKKSTIILSLVSLFLSLSLPYIIQPKFNKLRGYERYLPVSIEQYIAQVGINSNTMVFEWGIVRSQFLYHVFNNYKIRDLSEEEMQIVDSYIRKSNYSYSIPKRKNVIFILVESLLSVTSELRVDGKEVTPNLNRLKQHQGTFYNGNVSSNTLKGESSDGQLIYMTGLLPLKEGITVSKIGNRHFVGLPTLWKNEVGGLANIIVPTSPYIWNQLEMSRKYGFDDQKSLGTVNDSIVFHAAFNNLVEKQDSLSFFLIMTLSMHSPYNTCDCSSDLNVFPESYSLQYCNYLRKCNYTDKQIGLFIDNLKTNGLFDNSIIFITSDHQAHSDRLKMPFDSIGQEKLPFYIVNSPLRKSFNDSIEINQIDIFPSILDVLGIQSTWRGLGNSVFQDNVPYSMEEAHSVSTLILSSDYLDRIY